VRHTVKPLAYVRYGDDCLLLFPTRRQAWQVRTAATSWLYGQLKLTINPKNDVVIKVSAGLHWLGHAVTAKYAVVDKTTTRRVLARVNTSNVASYKALKLAKWPKTELNWAVLDKIKDILSPKA